MGDENETTGKEGNEVPVDTSKPAHEETAAVAAESGRDATVGKSPSSDAGMPPSGGDLGLGGQSGTLKRWSVSSNILIGVGIGVLTVLLLGGMFAVGYVVGKPSSEGARRVPSQQMQPQEPMQPDARSAPSPGRGGVGPGRPDVLGEYYDEIASVIAEKIGISVDDLQYEIADGKTIAEIAETKGVSTEDLTAAVAAKISEIADKLAADGEITTQQAENIKSNAEVMASRSIERGFRRAPMPPG
jgi:hypothetical protein